MSCDNEDTDRQQASAGDVLMHALQALGLMDQDGVRTWDARPIQGGGPLRLGIDHDRHPQDSPNTGPWWKQGGPSRRRRPITEDAALPVTVDWSPED